MSQHALEVADLVIRLGQLGATLGGRDGHGQAQLQRLLVSPQGGLREPIRSIKRAIRVKVSAASRELRVVAVPRQEVAVLLQEDLEQLLEQLRLIPEPTLAELRDLVDDDSGLVISLLRVRQSCAGGRPRRPAPGWRSG